MARLRKPTGVYCRYGPHWTALDTQSGASCDIVHFPGGQPRCRHVAKGYCYGRTRSEVVGLRCLDGNDPSFGEDATALVRGLVVARDEIGMTQRAGDTGRPGRLDRQ